MTRLKALTTFPIYDDPEKTHLAKLLVAILFALSVTLLIYLIYIPFSPDPWLDIPFAIILVSLITILFVLLHQGHLRFASWLLTLATFSILVFSMLFFGGISSSSYSSLAIVIIVSAILLSPKIGIVIGIISIFVGGLFLTAEIQGLFLPSSPQSQPIAIWVIQSLNLLSIALLVALAAHTLNKTIHKTRKSETALSRSNEELLANTTILEEQEAVLLQLLEDLTASEENYRTVYNAASEAILIQDAYTGEIIDINQAMLDMYGYQYQEARQLSISDLSSGVPPYSDLDVTEKLHNTTLDKVQLFEWRAKRKNGELFWVEVALSKSMIGNSPRVLSVVRDITLRKNQEADREALITQLKQKNDELERFTYTISHDLKSPLITINGFLGYLEQDIKEKQFDSAIADIAQIRQATTRMQHLLDELLELSRIGRITNEIEEILFNDLIDEAMQAVSGQALLNKIDISIMPQMPSITGDRPRLVAVVQNLLDNAIKFIGTPLKPQIEIGYEPDQDTPVFYVKDNGIGIEPQYQDKVFEIFERLTPAVDGTGIGLALVKRIIELHNGRLWVESEGKGKGSTFFFTIPDPDVSQSTGSPNLDYQTEF